MTLGRLIIGARMQRAEEQKGAVRRQRRVQGQHLGCGSLAGIHRHRWCSMATNSSRKTQVHDACSSVGQRTRQQRGTLAHQAAARPNSTNATWQRVLEKRDVAAGDTEISASPGQMPAWRSSAFSMPQMVSWERTTSSSKKPQFDSDFLLLFFFFLFFFSRIKPQTHARARTSTVHTHPPPGATRPESSSTT